MRKVPLTSFLDAHLAMAAPPRFSFGIASSTTFPAWVSPVYLARSPQPVLIPGTSSVTQLEENIASVAITLTQEEQQALATHSELSSISTFRD